ncbi:MAG: hypothetical protein ABEJ99_04180 [Candidatus Nanohaloarchaea archaeon]
MGRTNATYRNHLDSFINRFKPFQRALRKENQKYLDSLWEKAHRYASAGSYMNASDPALPALISIMIGQQKEIYDLKERIEELEECI